MTCPAPPVPDAPTPPASPAVVEDDGAPSEDLSSLRDQHTRTTGTAHVGAPPAPVVVTPAQGVVIDAQDAPPSAPVPVSPPPAPPAAPAAPCTTGAAASGTYASGAGQHGLASIPLAILGTEIAAPVPLTAELRWIDVPARVIGGGDDPGCSPD